MIPLDRVGAIKVFKKAGFIHTEKQKIEKLLLLKLLRRGLEKIMMA